MVQRLLEFNNPNICIWLHKNKKFLRNIAINSIIFKLRFKVKCTIVIKHMNLTWSNRKGMWIQRKRERETHNYNAKPLWLSSTYISTRIEKQLEKSWTSKERNKTHRNGLRNKTKRKNRISWKSCISFTQGNIELENEKNVGKIC